MSQVVNYHSQFTMTKLSIETKLFITLFKLTQLGKSELALIYRKLLTFAISPIESTTDRGTVTGVPIDSIHAGPRHSYRGCSRIHLSERTDQLGYNSIV